jgi:hypothetical protein
MMVMLAQKTLVIQLDPEKTPVFILILIVMMVMLALPMLVAHKMVVSTQILLNGIVKRKISAILHIATLKKDVYKKIFLISVNMVTNVTKIHAILSLDV